MIGSETDSKSNSNILNPINSFPLREWRASFLEARGCANNTADGRALHSYRCSSDEFLELRELLSSAEKVFPSSNNFMGFSAGTEELLVLYCAEWWRREFQGGPWKWQPIIDSLGWTSSEYKDWTESVRVGLRHWKRKIIKTNSGNQYLLSVACEGGIPINVLQEQGTSFRSYLKALISEYSRTALLGIGIEEIAAKHKNKLPISWQQDQIITLSCQLVDQVWQFSNELESNENPVEELSSKHPNWADALPIALEDEQAGLLVNTLLQSAKQSKSATKAEFKLERFLELSGENWNLIANLLLPENIDTIQLRKLANKTSTFEFPERLELFKSEGNLRTLLARLSRNGGNTYRVRATSAAAKSNTSNVNQEYRLVLTSKTFEDIPIDVLGGDELNDDLPWCFTATDEMAHQLRLFAQGGGQCSEDQYYVLAKGGSITPLADDKDEKNRVISRPLGRELWHLHCPVEITEPGLNSLFRIDPNIEKVGANNYQLNGIRAYFPETTHPLFRSIPSVQIVAEHSTKQVPNKELVWRYIGSTDWHQTFDDNICGDIELRHRKGKYYIAAWRISILPHSTTIEMQPTSTTEGAFTFIDANDISAFVSEQENIESTLSHSENGLNLHLKRSNLEPNDIRLKLKWRDRGSLNLTLPFPANGVSVFGHGNTPLAPNTELDLSRLYGYYAKAIYSNSAARRYIIKGTLKSSEVALPAVEHHSFEYPMSADQNGVSIISLQQLQSQIEGLFAISNGIDDYVNISIHFEGSDAAIYSVRIRQFEGSLILDEYTRIIMLHASRDTIKNIAGTSLKLISLNDHNEEKLVVPWNNYRQGWALEEVDLNSSHCYFAILNSDQSYHIRPGLVPNSTESDNTEASELSICLLHKNASDREAHLSTYLTKLSQENDSEKWNEFISYLKHFIGVHPDGVDLIQAAIEHPAIMANVWLQSANDEQLQRYLNYVCQTLPFSWWMIQMRDWKLAANNFLSQIETVNISVKNVLIDHLVLQLDGLTQDNHELNAVTEMLIEKIKGAANVNTALEAARNTPAKTYWGQLDQLCTHLFIGEIGDERWPQIPETNQMRESLSSKTKQSIKWPADNMRYQKSVIQSAITVAATLHDQTNLNLNQRIAAIAARNFHPEAFATLYRASQAILWVNQAEKEQ